MVRVVAPGEQRGQPPRSQPWGGGLSPSPSSEWEQGVEDEGAELGQSLRDFAEAASKEHMSQSVFPGAAAAPRAGCRAAGGGWGRGVRGRRRGRGSPRGGGAAAAARRGASWVFPSSGSGMWGEGRSSSHLRLAAWPPGVLLSRLSFTVPLTAPSVTSCLMFCIAPPKANARCCGPWLALTPFCYGCALKQ